MATARFVLLHFLFDRFNDAHVWFLLECLVERRHPHARIGFVPISRILDSDMRCWMMILVSQPGDAPGHEGPPQIRPRRQDGGHFSSTGYAFHWGQCTAPAESGN